MTEPIIKSRKCKLPTPLSIRNVERLLPRCLGGIVGVFMLSGVLGLPARAASSALPKLPVIQNVGVIPVQWEGDETATANRQVIDDDFGKVVRDSRRFRVLSDDLVAGMWNTPDGRAELRTQFELHAFLSLAVHARGDTYALTVRLMDSWLKSEIQESDTVSADWLVNATPEKITDRLEGIVFRVLNRIPVDVSVTSVQGPYVTLSGGSEQGIEVGDKVDILRTSIRALHPANGTWLEFDKRPLGTAKVIDVKNFTSVARIASQTRDNAIEVGDGARIAAIAARVKFARLAANDGFHDAGEQGTIIVPPLYNGGSPGGGRAQAASGALAPTKMAPESTPSPDAQAPPSGPTLAVAPSNAAEAAPNETAAAPHPAADGDSGSQKLADNQHGAENPQATNPDPEPAPSKENSGPSVWEDVSSDLTSHKFIDDINVYVGPYWWSVNLPPYSTSGKFPSFLLNSVGGGITHTLLYKIKTAFGGGGVFGKTDEGNYFGYDSYARMYWEDQLYLADGILKGWQAGGAARFNGVTTDHGHYGGGDWVRGGVFGGLFGSLHLGETKSRYDWFGDFELMPLNIGRVGFAGSRSLVQSSFGTRFAVGAFRFEPARIIQWGGGIEYGDETETLDSGRRPEITEYTIKLMAKYTL